MILHIFSLQEIIGLENNLHKVTTSTKTYLAFKEHQSAQWYMEVQVWLFTKTRAIAQATNLDLSRGLLPSGYALPASLEIVPVGSRGSCIQPQVTKIKGST